jgi:YidC/Oxa1 family membrane protein insertase
MDGSIALEGARIDDVSLKRYRQRVEKDSPEVVFLNPERSKGATYGFFGWLDFSGQIDVVGANTVWSAPQDATLTPETPLVLTYDTGDGVVFTRTISVDQDYLFTVADKIENKSDTPRSLRAYGAVRRHGLPDDLVNYMTLHEGFTGVLGGRLKELDYKPAERGRGQDADKLRDGLVSDGGWMGITDKYWLAALIVGPNEPITGRMRALAKGADDRIIYEASFTGEPVELAANGVIEATHHMFAGAKRNEVLQRYQKDLGATDFDKAIDWGIFYFLTRPFFWLLDTFYKLVGNFGIAIMLATVVVKAALFPLVYQSYKSMSKLKKIQPKMQELQERYAADKPRLQQEMIKLYQTEKINPVSGCLPILLQIPIFYALYKTLLVTLEMRHAPFFGWVKDLSAPDPAHWYNLFGLLPFDGAHAWPVVGFFFAVGLWPILYGVSMWGVTSLNPPAPDPIQQRIFALMPILFTFMFASFAVGMVIYWTWSNVLSFLQQYVIMRRQGVETELDKWIKKLLGKSQATQAP